MSLTKDDVKQIGAIVVEVTAPMFEHVIETLGGRMDTLEDKVDKLEGRMDRLEGRMDGVESKLGRLETEFRSFKAEIRTRLESLEAKIDHIENSHTDRFTNMDGDIRMLYHLVGKLEKGTEEEKIFAEQTIVRHLPVIYKSVMMIAKKHNISLDT